MVHQLAEWLETTQVALFVRESLYGFALVVGIHILGLMCSVGMIVWFDLRLLGVVLRDTPVRVVYRRIIPWAASGFAVMFMSGTTLLVSYATSAYVNPFFWAKMTALLVAGLNALVYHRVTERTVAQWDSDRRPPSAARLAGLVSIAAWAAAIIAGRAMSYTMF